MAASDLVERAAAPWRRLSLACCCDLAPSDKLSREWLCFPMVKEQRLTGRPAKTASALRLFTKRMLETRRPCIGLAGCRASRLHHPALRLVADIKVIETCQSVGYCCGRFADLILLSAVLEVSKLASM